MAGALGVAERLLALEAAVAEIRGQLRTLAAGGTGTAGSPQAKTRTKVRPAADTLVDEPSGAEVDGVSGGAPEADAGDEELSGPERLVQTLGNARLAAVLVRAGCVSPEAVAAAADEDLLAIDGVSERALRLIRARLA
ncbi:MAG: hypothetical protein U0X20_25950 [Caldilineaceae bacterium]